VCGGGFGALFWSLCQPAPLANFSPATIAPFKRPSHTDRTCVPVNNRTATIDSKTVPDAEAVKQYIAANGVKRAVVIGGGFIGLEMVENLVERWVNRRLRCLTCCLHPGEHQKMNTSRHPLSRTVSTPPPPPLTPHPTHRRNIAVTLLEAGPQLMPPLDIEMTQPVNAVVASKGVDLQLGDGVAGFEQVGARRGVWG
jgi:hypothetical protein